MSAATPSLGARLAAPRTGRPGVGVPYRWELRGLLGQLRVRAVLLVCVIGPVLLVAAVEVQPVVPADTLIGRQLHDSGWAVPLFLLGFGSLYALPALAGLIAGDLFSAEDRHGSWGLLLIGRRSRRTVVAAKLLAAGSVVIMAVLLLGGAAITAGAVFLGTGPLLGLSGQPVTGTSALGWTVIAVASVVPPVLAFAAMSAFCSAASRTGVVGVAVPVLVGLASQGLALVDLPAGVWALLPTSGFDGWHGLFLLPVSGRGVAIGTVVSLVWMMIFVLATVRLVDRRDLGR